MVLFYCKYLFRLFGPIISPSIKTFYEHYMSIFPCSTEKLAFEKEKSVHQLHEWVYRLSCGIGCLKNKKICSRFFSIICIGMKISFEVLWMRSNDEWRHFQPIWSIFQLLHIKACQNFHSSYPRGIDHYFTQCFLNNFLLI